MIFGFTKPKDILWFRYVDDVFTAIPTTVEAPSILDYINALVPSIKLSCEESINNKMPFLDVLIDASSGRPRFKVFRKATHVNSYLHWFYTHPKQYKRSVLVDQINRAFKVCSQEFLIEELDFIKSAFIELG